MFSKPRPVPSKAALKFLYQLAYISSGTAVGVATLCAEERRRRTHIVQKIADNAKRLRQSPRHVHNAAALAERHDDDGLQDQSWVGVKKADDATQAQRRSDALLDRSAHAPELPSFVERGYGQLVETDYKHSRRRAVAVDSGGAILNEDGSSHRKSERTMSHHTAEQKAATSIARGSKGRDVLEAASEARNTVAKDIVRSSPNIAPVLAEAPSDMSLEVQNNALIPIKAAASREMVVPDATSSAPKRAPVRTDSPTDQPLPGQDGTNLPLKEVVCHSSYRPLEKQNEMLADHDCSMIRSLIGSESSFSLLTPSSIQVICRKARTLAAKFNEGDAIRLYARLVQLPAFVHLPHADRLHCALMVLLEAIQWDLELPGKDIVDLLLRPKAWSYADSESFGATLASFCDELITKGRTSCACDLIRVCRANAQLLHLFPAEDVVLRALLDSGSLDRCAKLLRLRVRDKYIDRYLPLIERFATACHQARNYRALVVCISPGHAKVSSQLTKLSDEARTAIAISFTTRKTYSEGAFLACYQSVPEDMRHTIDEARTCTRLRDMWRATHDFDAITHHYTSAKTFAASEHLSMDTLTSMELTMIEICNSANRPDRALEILSSLSASLSHSSRSLCSAAVALAKKKSWKQLDDFLNLLERSRALSSTETIHTDLNHLIHLYSKSHTAVDTWHFVTGLIQKLKFTPNRSTSSIMLQCFVSKEALELVPRWLRLTRAMGVTVRMDGSMAADMLKYYQLEHRPPYFLLERLSRQLTDLFPPSETERLRDEIKESISYDLRKRDSRNRQRCQEGAKTAMAILGADGISTPDMRARHSFTQPGSSLSLSADGIHTPRMPALNESTQPADALNLPPDASGISARVGNNDFRVNHTPAQTTDATDLHTYNSFGDSSSLNGSTQLADTLNLPPDASTISARVGNEDVQVNHIPAQTTDAAGLHIHNPFGDSSSLNESGQPAGALDLPPDASSISVRVGDEDVQVSHTPALGESSSLSPPTSEERANGLDAHRKEAELAAEASLQDLLQDFNSDKPDISVGAGSQSVPPSDGGGNLRAGLSDIDAAACETTDDGLIDGETGKLDYAQNPELRRRLVRDMLAAFSLQQYQVVVDLYHESKSIEGLPASPMALEITIEASLRSQRGNPAEAEAIMTAARGAGMNVTCAMAPILLHRMWHSDVADQSNANLLRMVTLDYYRMNAENGWPVRHHVGVTAASILINKGLPEHGISILNSIYHSEWAQTRNVDIIFMSVYLRGYAMLGSEKGLRWTLSTVLGKNMRVDRQFLHTIKRSMGMYRQAINHQPRTSRTENFLRALEGWRLTFSQRRDWQREQTKLFGKELVDVIARCEKESRYPFIDSDVSMGLYGREDWALVEAVRNVRAS